MNNTKYILIEFSPYAAANQIVYYASCVVKHGYIPILAHVERYASLFENNKWISTLRDVGCHLQINAYSLQNERNVRIKDCVRKLLAENKVSFAGSDAHRTNHRPYNIESGIDYIYKNCTKEYADNICYKNAEKLLNLK